MDSATFAAQGRATAGTGISGGLVILDFGRPAVDGTTMGTLNFSGKVVSLAAITQAVQTFIQAYSQAARGTYLTVAVGTNNSCGTGQPCPALGPGRICGCTFEPPNFAAWGAQLAATVEQLQSWENTLRATSPGAPTVKVDAADDAEPANDPAYLNTADVLRGYAQAVGGHQPSMIDFGSAEPGFWTLDQLYQVAYGFKPDVPVPEIYVPGQVADWTAVIGYARARYGVNIVIEGVLTDLPIGNTPAQAYSQMTGALAPIDGQHTIRWLSNIDPL